MNPEQSKIVEALYLRMFALLLQYARSALKNEALAEEAVQETFRVACQKPDTLCASPNPEGWLVLALKNTIQSIRRNTESDRSILERYLTTRPKEISCTEEGIQMRILYSDMMDSEDFRLLSELAIENRSYKEMADARGLSVDTCRKRVQRARDRLKKFFDN